MERLRAFHCSIFTERSRGGKQLLPRLLSVEAAVRREVFCELRNPLSHSSSALRMASFTTG